MFLKKKILKRILKSSSSSSEKRNKLETNGDSTSVFRGQYRNETSNIEPREIYVPYTPFRRDRFYDWPPSATVSRATPLNFSNLASSSDAMDNILESMLIDKQGN